MDKNKSRTDLLAAGRKRLEKFREKKDNKGSNSKSTVKATKAGKSTRDASVDAASEAAVTPQNVADGEKSNHHTQDTSALSDLDVSGNLVANDTIASTDEISGKAVILEKASSAKTAEIQSEDSVNKTRLNSSAGDACDIDSDSEILHTGRSSSLVPEDAKYDVPYSPNVVAPREIPPDSGISMPADFTSQLERPHSEEQEVGCSSENQNDGGMVTQIEGDSGISPNEFTDNSEKAIQLIEPDNGSIIVVTNNDAEEAQQGEGLSIGTQHLIESDIVPPLRCEVSGLVEEDVSSGLSDEKEKETFDVSGVYGNQGTLVNPEAIEERGLDSKTYGTAITRGCRIVDLSSQLDGGLIKLSQLAEILQILDEDDFKFLFMSISPEKFRDGSNTAVHDPAVHDTIEKLKEELYVASFARDAFHLQLSEHQKLIDQDFVSNALVNEILGKNEILEEGIGRCRDELLIVVSEREELQKNLQFSNAEVEAVSTKANELQDKLEIAQRNMSSLSSELVDCKNLITSLQAEIERDKGQLKMMNEETKKLLEDKENILHEYNTMMGQLADCKASLELMRLENVKLAENEALLRDEMRQLYEENDYFVCEKNTLLADLKEHKKTLESLESENRYSHETLRSLSEERKKIEEERDLVILQNANLSKELTDVNVLMVTLQAEISNLHRNLTSITEDKNMYEEERESILNQFEKQWHELMEIKVLEASLKSECSKVVDDLKKARIEINNITGENETLRNNMEFHKSNTREFDREIGFEEVANDSIRSEVLTVKNSRSMWLDKSSMEQMELNFYDDAYGFVALKKRLEDAGAVLQNIEKAIEAMHLHATSLSRSNNKVVAPGVSRLIQAFEIKNHTDNHPVEPVSSEDLETEGPYSMTKNFVQSLGALIDELVLDAENATEVFVGVRKSKLHAVTNLMSNYDYLRMHADVVEEAIIEHLVVFEVMREQTYHAVAKESDLLIQCDALQQTELLLKLENGRLREKLNHFQTITGDLQNKLDEMYKDSDDIAASISHEIKILQTELVERETILEEEWKSVIGQVLLAVGELDSTINTFDSASAGANSESNVVSRISTSAFGAIEVIKDLNGQLEAAEINHQVASNAYDDLLEKWSNLQGKHEMAIATLDRLYNDLSEIVSSEIEKNVKYDRTLDILHPDVFSVLLDQLKRFLGERFQLESANKQLNSKLMSSAGVIDVLEKNGDKLNNLIELVEVIVGPEGKKNYADEPTARLETMISLLVQKYKEAYQSLSFSSSLEVQLSSVQGQVEELNFTLAQYENENLVFKQSLKSAEDHIVALNSKVQEMVAELEQSELRVSSLREKLGIAVTKGKGLILQRDSLKQSLAETSKELDKCSHELLTKDTILHDLETKLKVFSEAGERMEALESELSYIRNSSTALRESFLLKDSVLQRIEEILEDLELPEHFHARDILEKIDWLAKSVTGNSAHLGEWDQRSSVGGGSYSDTGFAGTHGLKDEMQLNLNSGDDVRRRYEELQSKFYDLAEQNEMLEQSLMHRNNLVQLWEEVFDRIDMPSQMRSLEPEDKIQWFERVLTDALNLCSSLQEKIDNLESHCGSLTADMQDSHGKISELDTAFQQACKEKEILFRDLESLSQENTEISKKTFDFEIRNDSLQNEISMLQDQKLQIEKEIHRVESVMSRMQDLVKNALQSEDLADGQEEIKSFEEMLSKLIEKYTIILAGKSVNSENIDVHVTEKDEVSHFSRNPGGQEVEILGKNLEDLIGELDCLKDEKDSWVLKNQSLVQEIEELQSNKNELRELLSQEEQKSASLREKLNVAVRKGKSLVQQRDGMKQVIEELNTEVERLRSEINHKENIISEYGTRINELSTLQERLHVMESENTSLTGRLAETESRLQVKEGTLSRVLDALGDVDIGLATDSENPIEKLKEIETNFHNMRTSLSFAEQESRKSKRAAELLLAELNEVQGRNDVLQEELSEGADELSKISKEKESAEGARYEALSCVDKLSSLLEEKERQFSEVMVLNSGVEQLKETLIAFESRLGDVLSKDRDALRNMANIMKALFESGNAFDLSALFPHGTTDVRISNESENKSFSAEIGSLNEKLHKHSYMVHEEICYASEVMKDIHREFVSEKELNESEIHNLQENVSLLYEACVGAIFEIEKWKDLVDENCSGSRDAKRNLKSQNSVGGYGTNDDICLYTTEGLKSTRDKLLLAVRDCTSMQTELNEVGQREMKDTIVNLQKELQLKDIQGDKICKELVHQIKEAETNAKNYLQDLHQARAQLHDFQRQVDAREGDCKVLEQTLKKLQDQETICLDLQKKLNSLTDALAAKEQENEALIQALDEEESQMEDLANKIGGLENELKQKNQDLENLEASRTKTLKKLSVTVSKFDELHYLSENLLSEVENLQSQLQERDGEISFLRQEVTRCTNDALNVTQLSKKNSDEIHDLLTWLDTLISPEKSHDGASDDIKGYQVDEYKKVFRKQITALISELENLRLMAKNNDVLLQEERSKVEELAQKQWYLENSLRYKESEIVKLQGTGDSGKPTNTTSEIVEVEPITNKRASPRTIAPQVRSLRKTNNDQVAIAIDVNHSDDRLVLDDDDDKAHGFKSLTTSKIVPRFTRPVSDMIDGLWVSCDRALMRRPALRLGIIIYWALLHALLANFVV